VASAAVLGSRAGAGGGHGEGRDVVERCEVRTGGATGVGRGGPGSDDIGRAGPVSSRSAVAPLARPREKAREWERVRDEGEPSASSHGAMTHRCEVSSGGRRRGPRGVRSATTSPSPVQ
jgi:hypothetical protein